MATIGGIACDVWNGSISPMRRDGRIVRRPGRKGFGVLRYTETGEPSQIITMHFPADATALKTLKESVAAAQFSVVAVTDGMGTVWDNVFIDSAEPTDEFTITDNGVTKKALQVTWVMMAAENNPPPEE